MSDIQALSSQDTDETGSIQRNQFETTTIRLGPGNFLASAVFLV